jgi:phage-related protein
MKTNMIENISIRTASTVKQQTLIDEIKPYMVKINELSDTLAQMEVKDDQGLAIFEGNLKDAKMILKGLKHVLEVLLTPLKTDMDLIKNAFKTPMDRIADSISKGNTKSLNYKEEKANILRLKREEEERKIQEQLNQEKHLIAMIESLQRRMNAYLFGGSFPTRDGEVQSSAGLNSLKECDNLLITIDHKFPSPETYGKFGSEVDKIRVKTIDNIYALKDIFEMINSPKESVREEGLKKMNKLRADNQIETDYAIQKIEQKAEVESAKMISNLDKEIKNAKKNVRRVVAWEVTDKYRIPVNYMNVDDRLVNNFKASSLEKIKEKIESGEEASNPSISGIRFFFNEQNISR